MSTSEGMPFRPDAHSGAGDLNPGLGSGLASGPASGLALGLGSGVLSPAELARMANAMFQSLPDEAQQPAIAGGRAVMPPNSALTGNPYTAVPGPTAPPAPGLLSEVNEAKPQTYVSVPDRSIAPDVRGPAPTVPPPLAPSASSTIPGGIPVAPTYAPAFAFLEDARPLETPVTAAPQIASEPPHSTSYASPVAGGGPVSVGDERGFAAIPASLLTEARPAASSAPFAGASQPPTPAIPGGLSALDASPVPVFSFIEDARPIFSASPELPGPVPADASTRTDSSASPFVDPLDRNAPQLPGAVAHPPNGRGAGSPNPSGVYDQPSGTRPLEPASFVPVLAPSEAQADPGYALGLSSISFDVEAIRRDFPILQERVNGRPLIWFDNGATTQKPQSVIDRISYFYEHENSNVHRAAHELAARATDAYESAREKTRRFLNASSTREIIFVRGATEAINLVAQSWGRRNIQKDDEIVLTWMEHHANIVPWQMLCAEKGARLRIAPVDDSGQILLDEYEKLLNPKTRLVSITQVSNALGTIVPVKEMTEAAHRHGACVLVDGAQAVSHMRVDVQSIGCDFYVFSGHKVFAPTGIGVVFGKSEVLENMPPWQGGGNMIQDVTFEKTLYQGPPQRFEAGTGNIADAVGLGAAIDYLDRVGIANVARHEHALLDYATEALLRIPGLHIVGTAKEKASVLSFTMNGFRTEEIGDYLNRKGIAVRGGHHCAQPILRRFGLESTLRATFALYNTFEEVDSLVAALWDLRQGRTPGLL